jgi:hypothetical protein
MEGFYRYARSLGARPNWAAALSPVATASGYVAVSAFLGWINLYTLTIIPWVLFGARLAALRHKKAWLVLPLAFVFILGHGGAYTFAIAIFGASLEWLKSIALRFKPQRILKDLEFAAATALFTLFACAYRLWPIFQTMRAAPRVMAGTPGHPWQSSGACWPLFPKPNPGGFTPEGAAFIGLPAAVLIALGLFSRRSWATALLAGLTFWICTGYQYSTLGFATLRNLPIFETLRYPERFLPLATHFGLAASAAAISWWGGKHPAARKHQWAAALALGLLITAFSVQTFWTWNQAISLRSNIPAETLIPFANARGNQFGCRGVVHGIAYPRTPRIALHVQAPFVPMLHSFATGHDDKPLRTDTWCTHHVLAASSHGHTANLRVRPSLQNDISSTKTILQ